MIFQSKFLAACTASIALSVSMAMSTMAAADHAHGRLDADLTVDGQTYIVAQPGQQVFYRWQSFGAQSARSWYTVTGNGPCTSNHGGPWIASSLQGQAPSIINANQAGCSFMITYEVTDQFNQVSQSTITVEVEDNGGGGGGGIHRFNASLTANGSSYLVVRPGQQVVYRWNSEGAQSARSWYTVSGSGPCTSNQGGAWVASSLSGQTSSIINANQAGCSYIITYAVYDQFNQSVQDTITIDVR